MAIKKAAVIGAGQMGGGIIQVFAQSGYDTTVWVKSDCAEIGRASCRERV